MGRIFLVFVYVCVFVGSVYVWTALVQTVLFYKIERSLVVVILIFDISL